MRSVPQFDFINPNFLQFFPTDYHVDSFIYNGPSQLVQKIATATAARGEILAITPPALNASWNLEFWGPSIRCTNVSDPLRGDILNNFGGYIEEVDKMMGNIRLSIPYFSWASWGNDLPFINDSSGPVLQSSFQSSSTVFLAYDNDLHNTLPLNVVNAIHNTTILGGWPQILSNFTILKCNLFNSSYALNFQYTNGAQYIDVSKTTPSPNPLTSMDFIIDLPTGPQSIWSDSTCNTSVFRSCFSQVNLQRSSYHAIYDAFMGLIVGGTYTRGSSSLVINTVLVDTDELRFLFDQPLVRTGLADSPAFQDIPFQPPQGTRGGLVKALEQLFENITISILSEPYLQ
jgi:hypothetical protein